MTASNVDFGTLENLSPNRSTSIYNVKGAFDKLLTEIKKPMIYTENANYYLLNPQKKLGEFHIYQTGTTPMKFIPMK